MITFINCSLCVSLRLLKTQSLEWFYNNVKRRFKRFGSAKVLKTLYRKHLVEHTALSELTGKSLRSNLFLLTLVIQLIFPFFLMVAWHVGLTCTESSLTRVRSYVTLGENITSEGLCFYNMCLLIHTVCLICLWIFLCIFEFAVSYLKAV